MWHTRLPNPQAVCWVHINSSSNSASNTHTHTMCALCLVRLLFCFSLLVFFIFFFFATFTQNAMISTYIIVFFSDSVSVRVSECMFLFSFHRLVLFFHRFSCILFCFVLVLLLLLLYVWICRYALHFSHWSHIEFSSSFRFDGAVVFVVVFVVKKMFPQTGKLNFVY